MLNVESQILGKSSYAIDMSAVAGWKHYTNYSIAKLPNKTLELKLLASIIRLTKKNAKEEGDVMRVNNLDKGSENKGNIKHIEAIKSKKQLSLSAQISTRTKRKGRNKDENKRLFEVDDEQDFDTEIQTIINILKNAVIKLNANGNVFKEINDVDRIATASELLLENFPKITNKKLEQYFGYISDLIAKEKSTNKDENTRSTLNIVNNSVKRLFTIQILQDLNSIKKTNKQTWKMNINASKKIMHKRER